VDLLESRDVTGAYVPSAKSPELLVATAASDMGALAVEKRSRRSTTTPADRGCSS
jgi:hypothetical protein